MKNFAKKWMMVFALIVLSAFIIPSIYSGHWSEYAWLVIQLLAISLIICLLYALTDKISLQIPLLKYLLELSIALIVVFLFRWIWKWDTAIWIVFAMVVPVYVVAALLDVIQIKRDVEIINLHIKKRQQKLNMATPNEQDNKTNRG